MRLTPELQSAIDTAAVLHKDQARKGTDLPYIVHPFSVMIILSEYTDDENILIASLLHDVLEDVPGYSRSDMERDFGPQVTATVDQVSENKDPNIPPDKKSTWLERKQKYLSRLEHDSPEALMVCAADKIHNLRTLIADYHQLGESIWQNFNATPRQKLDYYGQVLEVLKRRLDNPIIAELTSVFQEAQETLFPKP